MPTHDTQPPPSATAVATDAGEDLTGHGHPTAQAERTADETLAELARARQAADTPDDLTAAAAWRDIAALAGRLQREAREVAVVAAAEARGGAA